MNTNKVYGLHVLLLSRTMPLVTADFSTLYLESFSRAHITEISVDILPLL